MGAFSFELGKCVHPEIRERMVANLANVAAELCERVAANLGLDAPTGAPADDAGSSPALSQVPPAPGPIMGRVVGVLAADGVDGAGVDALRDALVAEGAALYVIAPRGGAVAGADGPVPVDRTVMTTQSVEYDAMVVAGGASADAVGADPNTALNLGEAFRHHKVIAAWGEGRAVLEPAGIAADAPGVVVGDAADAASPAAWWRPWAGTATGTAPPPADVVGSRRQAGPGPSGLGSGHERRTAEAATQVDRPGGRGARPHGERAGRRQGLPRRGHPGDGQHRLRRHVRPHHPPAGTVVAARPDAQLSSRSSSRRRRLTK